MVKKKPAFVVYNLVCPITKKIRYVGKSANVKSRYKQHIEDTGTETLKKIWISNLKKKRLIPTLIIISIHETEEDARIAENNNCILNIKTVFNIFMPGKNTPTVSDFRKINNIEFDNDEFVQPENAKIDKYNKF